MYSVQQLWCNGGTSGMALEVYACLSASRQLLPLEWPALGSLWKLCCGWLRTKACCLDSLGEELEQIVVALWTHPSARSFSSLSSLRLAILPFLAVSVLDLYLYRDFFSTHPLRAASESGRETPPSTDAGDRGRELGKWGLLDQNLVLILQWSSVSANLMDKPWWTRNACLVTCLVLVNAISWTEPFLWTSMDCVSTTNQVMRRHGYKLPLAWSL